MLKNVPTLSLATKCFFPANGLDPQREVRASHAGKVAGLSMIPATRTKKRGRQRETWQNSLVRRIVKIAAVLSVD